MPLSNSEKQRRFKKRNVIVLTRNADDIAAQLIDMRDQDRLREAVKKLRKVVSFISNHLQHPDRTPK
jgi:hypothetical protein